MLIALIVTGVLLSIGIPRFQQSLEQSRVNVAGADLRAIWAAQRLYWLENRTYAPDLNTLLSANLIDPSLPGATVPYGYSIASVSDSWFTATATRAGSANWSGSFTIAADGTFSGSVQQSTPAANRASARPHTRYGYTLLEVQIAFAVLGIGLAGLCPFVVMQLRQVRQLELRLQAQVVQTTPGTGVTHTMLQGNTYYIVPWTNVWTQKLAGSGQILTSATSSCDPGYLPLPSSPPQSYPVTIIELDATPYGQSATAYVTVSAP